MIVRDSVENNIALLEISGKILGGEQISHFHQRIHELLENGVRKFVLDFEKVQWTNSLGLGSLVAAHASVTKADGRFILCATDNIDKLLTVTHLRTVFDIYPTRDDAYRAIG